MTQKSPMNECKHDEGFLLIHFQWVCSYGCGYTLNFDPFTFPHGVAYVVKEDIKPGPRLVPSLK